MENTPVLFVGAGLCSALSAPHIPGSIVVEKSRGVGGRLATRRIDGLPLNHGFLSWELEELSDLHELCPETITFPLDPATALPKALFQKTDVRLGERVESVSEAGPFVITTDKGSFSANQVVVTSPMPQVAELLGAKVPDTSYRPGLSFMAIGSIDERIQHQDVSKVLISRRTDDSGRERSVFTVQFRFEYAQNFQSAQEAENDVIRLVEGLGAVFEHHSVKWWKYATPTSTVSAGPIELQPGMWIANDACGDEFISPIQRVIANAVALRRLLSIS